MLAQEELHEENRETIDGGQARVYQDGLQVSCSSLSDRAEANVIQSSDSAEDTTFCIRLAFPKGSWTKRTDPWSVASDEEHKSDASSFKPPALSSKPPAILIFRARSKVSQRRTRN